MNRTIYDAEIVFCGRALAEESVPKSRNSCRAASGRSNRNTGVQGEASLPVDAELAALRMAEQQAEQDLRAARDAASAATCENLAPSRRRLIEATIAALTTGLEAIEAEMRIRQKLNEAGYMDTMAAFASHIDLETLAASLERARGVGAREGGGK